MLATNWAWLPEWTAQDKEEPRIVYFRRVLHISRPPEKLKIRISADSRYKLYVNGHLAEIGPCKGDHRVWYYDTVDLAPYLVRGENVLAVVVLRYPLESHKGNASIFRTQTPGLYLAGEFEDSNGTIHLSADENWKCIRDPQVCIVPESPMLNHLYISEKAAGDPQFAGWKCAGYADGAWETAKPLGWELLRQFVSSPANLQPRPIPAMKKSFQRFAGVHTLRQSTEPVDYWQKMLAGEGEVMIPANSHQIVEVSAGEHMTGFPRLSFSGGKGAQLQILYAESYYQPRGEDQWVKGDRTDHRNGQLQGFSDSYTVAGYGSREDPEQYEPFWFRTFRFIRLEITTRETPLRLLDYSYQETGYPLQIKTHVRTSDETMADIWDISQRTLRRCMHETYMDCPFYEQMQYAMDARTQILYTYAVSADDRLARKCFEDFRRSQRYDGMIACCYPMETFSVIPSFAVYYVLMLHDHMMYFGDRELIRDYLPSVDGVLNYYARNLTPEGLVNKTGGFLFRDGAWAFIDWAAQWDATAGIPPAGLTGPIVMESLLYVMALMSAAELAAFAGRPDTAQEYEQRAEAVRRAIRECCTDSDGMIQDGPGVPQYSQHCQVFGVLTNTLTVEQGKKNILRTLRSPEEYAQCSVAMAYYLFRALEKCDLYEHTQKCWDLWRDMLRDNLTTCVEEPVHQRSDCHAWGALALYELPAVVLGVRPVKPGFAEMEVKPVPGPFTWAEGDVITPRGTVRVRWTKEGDTPDLSWKLL